MLNHRFSPGGPVDQTSAIDHVQSHGQNTPIGQPKRRRSQWPNALAYGFINEIIEAK
jgi:hypothetical protein